MAENCRDPSTHVSNTDPEQMASDAEGVWSPDIEQSFQEALAIYPPCGRRKIILSDEGKMYGRNELIARYIKLRTGKTRSRKQVSSHIQVLARRKDPHVKDKAGIHPMNSMTSPQIVSVSAIHSKLGLQGVDSVAVKREMNLSPPLGYWAPGLPQPGLPIPPPPIGFPYTSAGAYYANAITHATSISQSGNIIRSSNAPPGSSSSPTAHHMTSSLPHGSSNPHVNHSSSWQSRVSTTQMPLRLIDFSAYIDQQRLEQPETYHKHLFVHIGSQRSFEDPNLEAIDIRQIYDKFPEKKGGLKEFYDKGPQHLFFLVKFWADLNTSIPDDAGSFYGVSTTYESSENMTVTCSTKVCSFGKQVVEKVETEYPRYENGRFVYRIQRSPMCEYMINFIRKLKHLPEKFMMNSVLENFTILQVVSNRDTQETLLCLAFVFEISSSEHGAQHHIFKLVRD
ncbi:transcriptional enhancer factor TEF-1 isoform X1 [Hydra vulgaris]|uniref:Transcriptional enhancer factor TEF-1 n=1 Tax=Hydra vulgaris TaxID=6087 RepID=T2MGW3_HYDVU|nr:transcriptional enhancer factor TEF-1 [Hydra vulgaris]XP_012567075.1 transcriptional enhancer factor TEF-1 [Hydra vulgaris]UDP68768.1 transcriptional enhanced associate domain protein [Hydra vulgaris]